MADELMDPKASLFSKAMPTDLKKYTISSSFT